jgi:hypothetical protein
MLLLLLLQVEWDILAAWVVANNLASNNVVWLVQIPRLYNLYRDQGIIENFAQVRRNLGFWHFLSSYLSGITALLLHFLGMAGFG